MQRRAFEIDESLGDGAGRDDAAALERLEEIAVPTLILLGGHDLEMNEDAADRLTVGIRQAQRIEWPDAAPTCPAWNIPTGSPSCWLAGSPITPTQTSRRYVRERRKPTPGIAVHAQWSPGVPIQRPKAYGTFLCRAGLLALRS